METVDIQQLNGSDDLRRIWSAYDVLYDVNKECTGLRHEIYGGPDSFRQRILDSSLLILVASTSVNEIIGGLSYQSDGNGTITIDFLGVKIPFQKQHIGSRLLEVVISTGVGKIIKLHCKGDSEAFGFYEKKGFRPQWNSKMRGFIRMELDLKSSES